MITLRRLPSRLRGIFACVVAITFFVHCALAGVPAGKLTWELVFAWIQTKWPNVPQMTTSELAFRLSADDPPMLIDTRAWEEFAVSHLPGAVWAETPAQIRAVVDKVSRNRAVVLYCSVGMRSSKAVARLLKGGRGRVFNLRGSIFQWANEGRALEHDGEPAVVVHPYNRIWGVLLDEKLHPDGAQ